MITQHRDLRTGRPIWEEYKSPSFTTSLLKEKLTTDILIIGAGISGAMMAESLSAQGLEVAIVDKREPLCGSTAASTALIQYAMDVPMIHLMKKIGKKNTIAAWRRSKLAVESLAMKIRELGIECAYDRRQSLYLPGSVLSLDELEEEARQRTLASLPCDMASRKDLRVYGIKGQGALRNFDDLAVNPVQMAGGFLKAALNRGTRLFSPVEIEALHHQEGHVLSRTREGLTIKARHVVFTTGYEMPHYLKARKHKVVSTFAIATRPVKGLPDEFPHVWEANSPYLYARRSSDGRIILGGEDENFSNAQKRDAMLPEKTKSLIRKMNRLLPDFDLEVDHAWTGSFGTSVTGLPTIGNIPGMPRCYGVLAFGGNGITFSRIAADLIAMRLSGQHDPDEHLYAFRT